MPATTDAPPLTPAARRILDTASTLFYRHGLGSVGVERIAEEAGTTKKTLYDRFGSKDGLITAYLQARGERWRAFAEEHRAGLGPGVTDTDRAVALLDALAAWMRTHDRGCGFVNAWAELAGTGHPGLALVEQDKAWTRARYVAALEDLGVPDAGRRGRELALVHEGAVVEATAGGRPEALDDARALLVRLVADGLAARGR